MDLENYQDEICIHCQDFIIEGCAISQKFICEGRFCEEAGQKYLDHNEEWADIKGFEGLYKISTFGRVKSSIDHNGYNGIMLKAINNQHGYLVLSLVLNKIKNQYRIHRLVAIAFIPNPENKPQVNHKDGNKKNNYIENLEWVTPLENMTHARNIGLIKPTKKGINSPNNRAVLQFDLEGDFIKEFYSIKSAVMETKIISIGECCRGKYRKAGGYKWTFKNKI